MNNYIKNNAHFFNRVIMFGIALSIWLVAGCKKLVEIPAPKTEPTDAVVFGSDGTSKAAIDGLYAAMYNSYTWNTNATVIPGLTADEIIPTAFTSSIYLNYINNQVNSNNTEIQIIWEDCYSLIYHANSIIEGVANSTGMTKAAKDQLTGEAKFIRALNHFYLFNLYGAVPLITTTDVKVNEFAPRTDSTTVYSQVIADLVAAESLLPADYSASGGERTRVNKYAAAALLARVYLYTGNLPKAEEEAGRVINNPQYQLISSADMKGINLKNNVEAIWQFDVSGSYSPHTSALSSLFFPQFGFTLIELRPELITSFEAGDLRLQNWVGKLSIGGTKHYYPHKYQQDASSAANPAFDEYHTVLRLGEQYLIRAEARIRQGNLSGGLADLNVIRNRAGLNDVVISTQSNLLSTVMHERRVELFFEHGSRWLDLKRTGTVDAVIGALKPTYKPFQKLYPIPIKELGKNFKLIQNPGY